jgi:hypothetical protein
VISWFQAFAFKCNLYRYTLVEANQSGLIAETIIDITPEIPIPDAQWGPLDSGCEGEGLVVCDRGKIIGRLGTPGPGCQMCHRLPVAKSLVWRTVTVINWCFNYKIT